MSVLWCVWFISRDDSPHVSFSFAEVCEMIFAHNVHCIIHFTFILVSPKLLTKQYPAFIEKRLNCRCTPPPPTHTHHCFLLCVHTMPTLQGLKFSFIPYFKKKKREKKKALFWGTFSAIFLTEPPENLPLWQLYRHIRTRFDGTLNEKGCILYFKRFEHWF